MAEPEFFLIGAPKSGTTALASYLAEHPGLFMAVPKEPHFFATDMPRYRWTRTWDQYRALFDPAPPGALCGEASIWYLYSREAVARIRSAYPDARLIVMLRRPDEMVHSLQRQLLFMREEDQRSMRRAWDLEHSRRHGRDVPSLCRDPKVLYYRCVARYGEQLERVFSHFPASRVKVILYEDFAEDPAVVYRDILSFLGVTDDARDNFPTVNPHKAPRSIALQSALRWLFERMHRMRLKIHEASGIDLSKLWLHKPVTRFLAERNVRPEPKPELEKELREEIIASYRDDILRLQGLIERDLSAWLRT